MERNKLEQLIIDAWRDGHENTNTEKGCIDYDADLDAFLDNKKAEINKLCGGNAQPDTESKCKHDVNHPVCPLCKNTGWYFMSNYGGGGQTVKCHCGANGL